MVEPEILLSIGIGIGLSAACGFRIFVPLLVLSLGVHSGHVSVNEGFAWIGTTPAIAALAVATLLEIGAYYIPWIDNLLDTVTTPAAVVAGIMVTASVVTELSPFLRWALAIIAGGGVAGLVQGTTVSARATSTVTTAGIGNPVVATGEAAGAVVASLVSILWPALALVVVALVLVYVVKRRRRRGKG